MVKLGIKVQLNKRGIGYDEAKVSLGLFNCLLCAKVI